MNVKWFSWIGSDYWVNSHLNHINSNIIVILIIVKLIWSILSVLIEWKVII